MALDDIELTDGEKVAVLYMRHRAAQRAAPPEYRAWHGDTRMRGTRDQIARWAIGEAARLPGTVVHLHRLVEGGPRCGP